MKRDLQAGKQKKDRDNKNSVAVENLTEEETVGIEITENGHSGQHAPDPEERDKGQRANKKGKKAEKKKTQKKSLKKEITTVFKKSETVKVISLNTFFFVLRSKWRVLLAWMVLGAVLSASFFYITEQYKASAVMSLNFEESSKGRNPNGTRFNISDFRSLEVAQAAIEDAGLTGKVEPADIVDAITISTFSNKDFVNPENYYISSSYRISFKKPYTGMEDITAEDMLSLLCKAYKEKFYSEHVVTTKHFGEENIDYEDMDYSEIGSSFTVIADSIDHYLDERINEASSFVTDDGETFKSLRKLITNLKDYDLNAYNAYIWENGVAKNKQQQKDTLKYVNHKLEWSYDEYMEENKARVTTIDEYNQKMISSILIPTYDEENEFYMSRTKTGIDDLAKEADKMLAKAKEIELQISTNKDKLKKLEKKTTGAQIENAEKMVKEIDEKLSDILTKITQTDNAYNIKKTRNYVTFKESRKSLSDQFHLNRIIAIVFVEFCVIYLFYALKRKREESPYEFGDEVHREGDGKK